MRRIAISVLILGLLFAMPTVAQVLPPMQVDHVTVTSSELATEFWRLAAMRQHEGMRARVVTLGWILANVPAGVDDAETVRHFVQAAHDEWGVQFVLLGGDETVVPVRYVHSTFYPYGGFTDIPADLYYGSLEGDWNADGDDLWGEPYSSESDPGDAVDLVPEVSVGRAPVSDAGEAARFVDGTIAADAAAAQQWADVLLMAEVLFPSEWQPGDPVTLDGAMYADELYELLASSPVPPEVVRMYERDFYPHDIPLTRDNAWAALDGGQFGMVNLFDHGWLSSVSVGDGVLTSEDMLGLANAPEYFVVTGIVSSITAFHLGDCLYEAMLNAPYGGAVAGVGASAPAFPSTSQVYLMSLYSQLYIHGPMRLGPALEQARLPFVENTERNTVHRWTHLSLLLLGDPALRMGPVPDWAGDLTAADLPTSGPRLAAAAPNPFNPVTELRFTLPVEGQARLGVYAVDGRRVGLLVDGTVAAGEHRRTWRACDAAGRPLPSGVYLARLEAFGSVVTQRLTLVR